MAEIVQGLFGVSTELFRQQQDAQFQQQQIALAQLDPQQQRFLQMGEAGRAIGRGLGGLLGAEDPILAKQTAENNLLQQVQASLSAEDLQDPYKLSSAVYQAAIKANMPELANHALQNIQVAKNQAIAQGKDMSVISENLAKTQKAYFDSQTKTEQYVAAIAKAELEGNTAKVTQLKAQLAKDSEMNQKSIDNRITELTTVKSSGKMTKALQEELDLLIFIKNDAASKGAAKTTIENFDKSLAGRLGPMYEKGFNAANQAAKSIGTINNLRAVVTSKDLFLGPTATLRSNIDRIAVTMFGAKDAGALGNTRQAIQGLAALALNARSSLEGTGSISDAEQALLTRATTGALDDFTRNELIQLLNIVERESSATHSNYKARVAKIKDPDLRDAYTPDNIPAKPAAIKRLDLNRPKAKYSADEILILQQEQAALRAKQEGK
jgi:hypothetical protein